MKTLKKILIVVIVIIAIPLVMALFVPKEFKGESKVVIDKPKHEVFDYVRQVQNQQNFGVWFMMDPDIRTSSEGVDGTEGYVLKWESDVVGNGSQTITKISNEDSVLSELKFAFGEPARGYFSLQEVDADKTEVTWGIQGRSPYPWNLIGLFMDFNEDFETGTQNLKTVLEAQKSPEPDLKELASYYDETYTNLVNSVKGLTDNQLQFKAAPDKWSVAQCVEHITLTAPKLFDYLKTTLDAPENPERKSEVEMKDEELLASMTNRDYKVKTSEDLEPATNSAIDVDGRLEELKMYNTEILEYVNRFDMEGLRNRIMDAPFGAVDAYQFALFIPGHTARHRLQIEEVKSHPDFPK